MQAAGIYLGYSFNWYIRGPYSPKLAADAFELENIKYKDINEISFPDPHLEQRFQDFLHFIKPFRNDPIKLETMASIHFLRKLHPSMKDTEFVDCVVAKKPTFSAPKVKQAWKELNKFTPLGV